MTGGYPHNNETVRAREERHTWGLRDRRLRPDEYRRRSSFVRFAWDWVISHPQAAELSDGQFRSWFALLASVVERDVPEGRFVLGELRRFVTPRGSRAVKQADLDVFVDLGLVEAIEGEPGVYRVRGWGSWNPGDSTAVFRQRAWRERKKPVELERLRALAGEPAPWPDDSEAETS